LFLLYFNLIDFRASLIYLISLKLRKVRLKQNIN
jgi:hypothetical protein